MPLLAPVWCRRRLLELQGPDILKTGVRKRDLLPHLTGKRRVDVALEKLGLGGFQTGRSALHLSRFVSRPGDQTTLSSPRPAFLQAQQPQSGRGRPFSSGIETSAYLQADRRDPEARAVELDGPTTISVSFCFTLSSNQAAWLF